MIQYSFSTVFMAFLSSNLIIVFTAICFCNRDLLVSFGYRMFALVLGITLLRFVFPFQFSFTKNIVLSNTFSHIISRIWHTRFMIDSLRISLWSIFEFIWIIGILVRLILFAKDELVFNHQVVWQSINLTNDERYSRLLDEVCGDRPNPFWVFELEGLKVPVLYGMRHPRILIPAGLEMPDNELRYLLAHETAHHYHHDILTKLGLSLLTIVYWWNPACYVLKAQLDAVLEMRVDNRVAGDTYDSKRGYLNCLVYVAEHKADKTAKRIKLPGNSIALFNLKKYNTLTNRFEIMDGEPKAYAKLLHVIALAMTVAIYLFSYFYIFEARYFTPRDEVTIDISSSANYAVLNDDGTYSIYYGGYLMRIVDTLDNYPKEMVIYNNLEDVPEELRVIISP